MNDFRAGCSYFGVRIARHVRRDMADLAARGYRGVQHTFSENDFAYYRATMAEVVEASHAEGLFVQACPWGVGRTFGGEAESRFVAFHPEECQVLDDGRRVAAACLNSDAYRGFCKEWADWVLECGVDCIFWDEPAWVLPEHVGIDDPSRWTCRCENCAERFGGPIPAGRTPEVQAFREAGVLDFLREMLAHVAARGGASAICVLPATEGIQGLSNWDEVASLPGLATLVTDPYWKVYDAPAGSFVRRFARLLRDTSARHDVGAQLWVPSFGLTREDIPDLEAAIAAAREVGIDDLWTWGYEACGQMTSLATPDSPLVWGAVSAALTRRTQQPIGPTPPGPGASSRRLGVAAAFVGGVLVPGDVAITDGAVAAVGLAGAGHGTAIPALVDAQVNGYAGIDLLSAGDGELDTLGAALLRDGVATYQPTLISSAEGDTVAALRRIAEARERGAFGARIAGVHLEGPFLSASRAGAHPPEHLRAPDPALLERLVAAGPVTAVTLAPELPGALELIELCVRHGVAVWLGHSEASAREAACAFAAGAAAVTHLFNAMSPISAREPGLAGAALASPGIALQLIADGVHVSDELLRVAFATAPGRCSLVTDAVAAAGLPDGSYRLGEVAIEVSSGVSRRADGVLAGSTGRLVDGLARLGALGLDPAEAVAAVTERPGRLLGGGVGRLELGGRADLLILDDRLVPQRALAAGRELDKAAR